MSWAAVGAIGSLAGGLGALGGLFGGNQSDIPDIVETQGLRNLKWTKDDFRNAMKVYREARKYYGGLMRNPLKSPTWQSYRKGVGSVYGDASKRLKETLLQRGVVGGTVDEGLSQLEMARASTLADTLKGISESAADKFYNMPYPTHGTVPYAPVSAYGSTGGSNPLSSLGTMLGMAVARGNLPNLFAGSTGGGGSTDWWGTVGNQAFSDYSSIGY